MNSILKGLLHILYSLGLIILFGFVLEIIVNNKTYLLLLIISVFTLFIGGCVKNIIKQSK